MATTTQIPPQLHRALSDQPHLFLQPTPSLHDSILQLSQQYLDPLAADITDAQLERQTLERQNRKKRRRRRGDEYKDREELLRMKRVHVEGFGIEQVWQQARRVLGAAEREVERDVPGVAASMSDRDSDEDGEVNGGGRARAVTLTALGVNGAGARGRESEDGGFSDEGQSEDGVDEEIDGAPGSEDESSVREALRAKPTQDDDEESPIDYEEPPIDNSPDVSNGTPLSEISEENYSGGEELVKDKHGLNDGFFSIDKFNKQSEFLEHQDARGDLDDGAASDEEEIDWGADPLAPGAQFNLGGAKTRKDAQRDRSRARVDDMDENDEEDEEEEGPTFGDADLDAPDIASEDEVDGTDDGEGDVMGMGNDFSNTNDILYADFFAPPARQKGKKDQNRKRLMRQESEFATSIDRSRSTGKNLAREDDYNDSENEMERAMSSVHHDLFEDSMEEDDDGDNRIDEEDSRNRAQEPKSAPQNLSTHEKNQLAIQAQIKKLEAENVAPKPFTLTGETVASGRPENALLEEDLDFERAGKPVPIITAELNESIEELIKRRVMAREFDNLIRRAPEAADLYGRRAQGEPIEEVSDSKPRRGLADEYAEHYLSKTDPNHVDSRSHALKAEHTTIERQWKEVSAALDALSNWHYKPRPPEPILEVRTNVPVVRVEEARPAGVEGIGTGASTLAPQEVYKAGNKDEKQKGVVTTKGGTVVAKDEESRESKRRRRRRENERRRKAEGNKPLRSALAASNDQTPDGKAQTGQASKNEILGQLKKGDVKVIGKKGELKDVDGRLAKSPEHRKNAATYLL